MQIKRVMTTLLLGAGLALAAQAKPADAAKPEAVAKAEKAYANIGVRMNSGAKAKQLTGDESAKLKTEYDAITKLWSDAKADGKVSQAELKTLSTRQAVLNKAVYTERTDAEGNAAKAKPKAPAEAKK